jgi:hypothetical protein
MKRVGFLEVAVATKNNPGKFDCYTKAGDDEPMFVLLARDPLAPILVRMWAELSNAMNHETDSLTDKEREAIACAKTMEAWESVGSNDREDAFRAFVRVMQHPSRYGIAPRRP